MKSAYCSEFHTVVNFTCCAEFYVPYCVRVSVPDSKRNISCVQQSLLVWRLCALKDVLNFIKLGYGGQSFSSLSDNYKVYL